jgi:8-hydroxy-5-deazaflavin:NADPH oxidoreductase
MKIAFIGIGQVGSALAGQLVGLGHTVMIAARDRNSNSVKTALDRFPNLQVQCFSGRLTCTCAISIQFALC